MNDEITKTKLLEYIADHVGVEHDDIKLEDSLSEQLHMNAAQIIDLMNALKGRGVEIEGVDLEEVNTVSELLDALNISEE